LGILLPKLFIVIVVVLLMWLVIVGSAPLLLEFDPLWTGLSLGTWFLIISTLVGIFIVLDIIFYLKADQTPQAFEEFKPIEEHTSPEYKDGKQVYEFTHPVGSKGGIYSKTYLQIDTGSILRIRQQMFTAEEVWSAEKNDKKTTK
jgi:hypothetical protein